MSISQDLRYRESVVKYAQKYGITKAAVKYRLTRDFVYRWKNRYDGALKSLEYRSKAPKRQHSEHTLEEIKQIEHLN